MKPVTRAEQEARVELAGLETADGAEDHHNKADRTEDPPRGADNHPGHDKTGKEFRNNLCGRNSTGRDFRNELRTSRRFRDGRHLKRVRRSICTPHHKKCS